MFDKEDVIIITNIYYRPVQLRLAPYMLCSCWLKIVKDIHFVKSHSMSNTHAWRMYNTSGIGMFC